MLIFSVFCILYYILCILIAKEAFSFQTELPEESIHIPAEIIYEVKQFGGDTSYSGKSSKATEEQQEDEEEEDISFSSAHTIFEREANLLPTNPQLKLRKINFGTAINRELPHIVLNYLPSFVRYEDTSYQLMIGTEEFREFVATDTPFHSNQIIAVNSKEAAIRMLFHYYQEVSIEGKTEEELLPIVSFAQAKIVSKISSKIHCIFISEATTQEEVIEKVKNYRPMNHHQSFLVLVINKRMQLFDPYLIVNEHLPSSKIVFIYDAVVDEAHSTSCGLVFSKNEKLSDQLYQEASFIALSSLYQGGIARNAWQSIDVVPDASEKLAQSLSHMLTMHEGVSVVDPRNFFFTTRVSCSLASIAQVVFQFGDILAIDAPYYSTFRDDFGHVGYTLEPIHHDNRFPRNTMLARAKRAKEDGFAGYIVCNPHNPTGYVYPAKEVAELFQWLTEEYEQYHLRKREKNATIHSDREFHIIVDELYAQSIWDISQHAEFLTGIPTAALNPWLHVVRGFAKDFGLCGFNVGIVFSSNLKIHSAFQQWKSMFQPSNLVLSVLNNLLLTTDYGKVIFDENQRLLEYHMKKICQLLEEENIDYHPPSSGIFLVINLSKILNKYPYHNEFYLWKKLVKQFALNISPGSLYGFREKGWFRICPTQTEDRYTEGIRRIGQFIREELSE